MHSTEETIVLSIRDLIFNFVSDPKRASWFAVYGFRALAGKDGCLVFRWSDVCEILENGEDFLIEPIMGERIEKVSGTFILGMDRCPQLLEQRINSYRALAQIDYSLIRSEIASGIRKRLSNNPKSLDILSDFARPIAARTSNLFFGIEGSSPEEYQKRVREIFHETFLNPTNDPKVTEIGRAAGKQLKSWIEDKMAELRTAQSPPNNMLTAMMTMPASRRMSDTEIADVLAGFLVGSIDTTTTCVAHIMWEALNDEGLMATMQADVDDERRLLGWCMEVLRRRPHNRVLVRSTARDVNVAGKDLKAGTTVVCVLATALQDPAAWPEPAQLDPTRPLDRYLHFGRGLHHCGGRDISAIQIPKLVGALLRRSPRRKDKWKFDGPFPNELIVDFDIA